MTNIIKIGNNDDDEDKIFIENDKNLNKLFINNINNDEDVKIKLPKYAENTKTTIELPMNKQVLLKLFNNYKISTENE